jgi:hypothetical protein
VVSVRFREDGCTYTRTSLDLEVPPSLSDGSAAKHRPTTVVLPITWWSKGTDLHRIDFRGEDGRALPLLHSKQQAALAFASMCQLASEVTATAPQAILDQIAARTCDLVVLGPVDAEKARTKIIKLWSSVTNDRQVLKRIRAFTGIFVDSYLVALVTTYVPGHSRMLVKYNFGQGAPFAKRERVMLLTRRVRLKNRFLERPRIAGYPWLVHPQVFVEDSDAGMAGSTHFEFEVTGEVVLERLAVRAGDREIRTSSERVHNVARSIAQLEVRSGALRSVRGRSGRGTKTGVIWVADVYPKKSTLTNTTRYVSVFSFVALAYFAAISALSLNLNLGTIDRQGLFETPKPEDFTRVIQFAMGLMSAGALFAVRSNEHPLTSFVLRPFRWIGFLTGVNLGFAAVLITPLPLQWWWVILWPALVFQGYLVQRMVTVLPFVRVRGSKTVDTAQDDQGRAGARRDKRLVTA